MTARPALLAALLLALAVLALSGPAPLARADVITLTSGDEIRGRILSETGGWLVIEVPGGEVRISRGQVLEIVREKSRDYFLEKGEEMLRLGLVDQAAGLFGQALDAGQQRAALRLALVERMAAGRARESGDLLEAERRLDLSRRAAARDPAHGAQAALEATRASEEIAVVRRSASELAARGRKLWGERKLDEALSALRDAIALDRSLESSIGTLLGRVAFEEADRVATRREYARAAVLFEEALRRAPENVTPAIARAIATCQLGVALERLSLGDPAAAIAALQAGLAIDPSARAVRFYLGLAHELRGERLEAAAQYRGTLAGSSAVVPDGEDLTPLRNAALVAAGKLPLDPSGFLEAARSEARPGAGEVVASRGIIEVRAPNAAVGAQVLESATRGVDDIAGWAGPDARDVPVVITIHGSKAEFQEKTGAGDGTLGLTRAPLSSSDATRRVFSYVGATELLTTVIPHEMTHAVAFGRTRGAVPLWLNEGLAISSEPEWIRATRTGRYRTALASGTALSIQEVMRMRGYPEESRKGAFYEAAAAVTGWLIDRYGKARVLDLARRAASTGLDSAFSEALAFQDTDAAAAAFLAGFPKEQK